MDGLLAFNIAFVGVAGALAALPPALVAASAMREGRERLPWVEILSWCFVLFAWFAFALFITNPGAFGVEAGFVQRIGFPLMFGGGVLIGALLIFFHPSIRRRIDATPLHWPIALQTARVVGGAFIIWAAFGTANWTFALIAGIGDIIVGVTAPFAAMIVARGGKWARPVAYGHTFLGLADFASAITTAFLVSGGGTGWPGVMIPNYLVPLATLMHVWTLVALWRSSPARQRA